MATATSSNEASAPAVATDGPLVNPRAPNPRGYPPFDLQYVPTYTNRQLRFYQASGALLSVDRAALKAQMEARKDDMELVDWDGNTRENTPDGTTSSAVPTPPVSDTTRTLSLDADSENDSECPQVPSGYRGIKFNASDIPKLRYDSTVAQYNNWLAAVKSAFDGDPSKFPTSRQKVIFASMTLDEQF